MRDGRIHYLISDRRLMDGPPLSGIYFEPQERSYEELTTRWAARCATPWTPCPVSIG